MDELRCRKRVWNDSFHHSQCKRKIYRDGFCKQHHPEIEKGKNEIRQQKWDEENKRQREVWRHDRAMKFACEDVPTEILEKIKVKELLKEKK